MPVTLTFSDQHMQVIADALGNHPLKLALPVVQEINRQIAEQQPSTSIMPPVKSAEANGASKDGG